MKTDDDKLKNSYHFKGIISGASYMVYDDENNIIGYSDTLGVIDYDVNFKKIENPEEVNVISVDESAWD